MGRLLRTLALALTLASGLSAARAEVQQDLVQRTLGNLRASAAALQQADPGKAQALLTQIRSSAESLRTTAAQYQTQAAAAEASRQKELIALAQQIDDTYAAEKKANAEVLALSTNIASLNAQYQAGVAQLAKLQEDWRRLMEEARLSHECNNRWDKGFFYGPCWELAGAQLFNNRLSQWHTDKADIENRSRPLMNDINSKMAERRAKEQELSATRTRKAQLEVDRQRLHARQEALRKAVVHLTDASTFWRDIVTLAGSGITSVQTLQSDVEMLVKRAQRTASVPVFDQYDRQEIRTLEATLLDFARTLDSRTNFLLH